MIGIGKYSGNNDINNLDGIKIDYNNIVNTFGSNSYYKYKIMFKYNNLNCIKLEWNETDIFDFVDEIRDECKKGKYDSLIFIFSCHGDKNNIIYDSNFNKILLNKIFKYFSGDSFR